MSQPREWQNRVRLWMAELPNHLYEPLGTLSLSMFETYDQLSPKQALKGPFAQVAPGQAWGPKWGYGWFLAQIQPNESAQGKALVAQIKTGGESLVYVNGLEAGAIDKQHSHIPLPATGEPVHILIESYAGHGPHIENIGPIPPEREAIPAITGLQATIGKSTYGVFDETAYQLLMDMTVLNDLYLSLPSHSLRGQKILKALLEVTFLVDFEKEKPARQEAFLLARETLAPLLACHNGSTAPEMFLLAQSHIDLAWMWPLAETRRKIGRTMATQTALLGQYEEAKYLLCEPYLIELLETHHPALYEKVMALYEKGQIILDGGVYIEGDSLMPSGEGLIRQIVYGRRFFKERFNIDSVTVWQPDVFGFSPALPQIYKGCGIRYFATQKLYNTYEGGDPFPYNHFQWQGIDGTKILSCLYRRSNAPMTVPEVIGRWEKDRLTQTGIDTFLFPFGYGDGGGGPTRDQYETASRLRDLEGAPRTHYDTPQSFFEDLETKGPHPIYRGELYYQAHRGVYTSQAETKRLNRRLEGALSFFEWAAALGTAFKNASYPYALAEALWKKLLFAQFHDILPGTSIARVHKEARELMEETLGQCNRETLQALEPFLTSTGDGSTAFNPLPVTIDTRLTLPNGSTFRGQLPPMSLTPLEPARETPCALQAFASTEALENDFLLAELDCLGRITRLYDKTRQMECAAGPMNDFKMYQDVNAHYDAWDIASVYPHVAVDLSKNAQISVQCPKGDVVSIKIIRQINQSLLTQTLSLEADSRALRFDTRIHWQEDHKLLKVAFPTSVQTDKVLTETQFGYVERPNHFSRPYDADRYEVCQHRWSALCDSGFGVALLNDSKYGISAIENTLALTLLKAPLAPDHTADRGEHTFTYELCVFDGLPKLHQVIAKALSLNRPPLIMPGRCEAFQAFNINQPNVLLDTFKYDFDGSDRPIIRLYEACGQTATVQLASPLPIKALLPTDMMETPLNEPLIQKKEGAFTLTFRPFEIKTMTLILQ